MRTAGIGRSTEELRWDLDYLMRVWEAIKQVVVTRPAPFLIYQEGNAIIRALRDYFSNDIGEILIDSPSVYQEGVDFMERVLPESLKKLKLYEDITVPLFTRYQIESQIESAYNHKVQLPSGGSIVIDRTEALTAIDINSARSTKGEDIEETALNTNLEAADEIGRQLRIRDLGGLVVVDFIDMGPQRNQREVEERLRLAVRHDRARIQIGKISRFGLLEMSRQRLRPSLEEATQSTCPRCNGAGNIRSVESLALAILRLVGEEARKERTARVIAQLPMDVANYILNEKRDWVQTLQESNSVSVVLIGNPDLETPNYTLRRVRDDEMTLPENAGTSYKLITPKPDPSVALEEIKKQPKTEEAAVSNVLPSTPAPTPPPPPPQAAAPPPTPKAKVSFFSWLFGWLRPAPSQAPAPQKTPDGGDGGDGRRHPRRDRDRERSSGDRDHRGGRGGEHRGGRDRDRDRDRDRGGDRNRNRGQRPQGEGSAARPPRNPEQQGQGGQQNPRGQGQGDQGRGGQGQGGQGQSGEAQGQGGQGQGGQGQSSQGQAGAGSGRNSRRSRSRRGGQRGSEDNRQRQEGQRHDQGQPRGGNGGAPPENAPAQDYVDNAPPRPSESERVAEFTPEPKRDSGHDERPNNPAADHYVERAPAAEQWSPPPAPPQSYHDEPRERPEPAAAREPAAESAAPAANNDERPAN